jgi:hypothetical protein
MLDDKDAKKRKFLAFLDSRDALEAAEAGFDHEGDTLPDEIRNRLVRSMQLRRRGQ